MGKWKKDVAQSANQMTQEQFQYQQKLINQREAERSLAMNQLNGLLGAAPQYQAPAQVQQYTNMMNQLGAQLYGLQDASGGAKSIDPSQYASQTSSVNGYVAPASTGASAQLPYSSGGAPTSVSGINPSDLTNAEKADFVKKLGFLYKPNRK